MILVPLPYADGELEQIRAAVDVPLATIGLLDHAANAYARGVTLFIDSITPHAVTFAATRELLRRHQEGLPSGMELADIMATYRELGDVGGFEGLYDIERATTERGT
jgi:methylisocitrate lyase